VSARKVEQWSFRKNYAGYTLLRVNKRPELVGSFDDSILALDEEGIILAIDNPLTLETVGYYSKELIGKASTQFFTLLRPDSRVANVKIMELKRASRKDSVLFALIESAEAAQYTHSGYANQVANKQREKSIKKVPTFKVNRKLLSKDAGFSRLSQTAVSLLRQGMPILIVGETGSGKNYIADVLHQQANTQGEFIEINMDEPALQIGQLIESRYRNPERNSEQVIVPTLFLDNIAQLNDKAQMALIKVIARIERMNAALDDKIKIISSSSCTWLNAPGGLDDNNFRKDLYYRLAGFTFPLSPLKSRKDKVYIFNTFLADAAGKRKIKLDAEVVKVFKEYDWPGNYWELKNVMVAAVTQSTGEIILKNDLPPVFQYQQLNNCVGVSQDTQAQTSFSNAAAEDSLSGPTENDFAKEVGADVIARQGSDLRHKVKNAERTLIIEALEKNFWNISQTAKQLEVSRKTLYRKMDALQISYNKTS
jgi:transcriptional regulator of acetoin/glycerol metabolism